jgi:hypothetical protein
MPDVRPTPDDDSLGSEEQRPAPPAMPGEAPADAEPRAASPESPRPVPGNDDVRPAIVEKNKPNAESESTAQKESDNEQTDGKLPSFDDFGERMLALERARDAQANIDTRPPDDEAVTFRSVTVAEIYAGQAVGSLTTAIAEIDWINSYEPILDRITEAQKGHRYSRGVFWLVEGRRMGSLLRHGRTTLPVGVDRIYGEYYVLGPSIVAVILTFVLADDEAKRIDAVLRDDAQSMLDRYRRPIFSVKTVRDIKRERIRTIRDAVVRRCLTWLKDRMPGTLSAINEGFGPPTCALISLAVGKPFDTRAGYMTLLDVDSAFFVEKFVGRDFLFLIHLLGRAADGWMVAAFNEAEAVGSGWVVNVKFAPELFHEEISSLMIADGLNAALRSFGPRLGDIRTDLNRLDIDKPAGTRVIELRNRLLGLSREVSTVCGDVTVLLDDAGTIWADFSPLVRIKLNADTSGTAEITADTTRRQLRVIIENLQAQEVELRELIIVTSGAMNETRSLNLTNTLNRLTLVLVALTIAVLAVAIVQLVRTPSGTAPQSPTSTAGSRTASPAPRPSPSPSGSASKTKALGLQG